MVSDEICEGGASDSDIDVEMLITHRSSVVITIQPIEGDSPSFRRIRALGQDERVRLV